MVRERHVLHPYQTKQPYISLPRPSALARSHCHPTSRCQLSLSRGRHVTMKMKRGRFNRSERGLWTCLCDVLYLHNVQYTVDLAKKWCQVQSWVDKERLKLPKMLQIRVSTNFKLRSEAKLQKIYSHGYNFVVKLIINRKDDPAIFWWAPKMIERFLINKDS